MTPPQSDGGEAVRGGQGRSTGAVDDRRACVFFFHTASVSGSAGQSSGICSDGISSVKDLLLHFL